MTGLVCVKAPAYRTGKKRLAIYKPRVWDYRRVLRVRFFDGDPDVHARVRAIEESIDGWSSASAMQFQFVDHGYAEIRVTFTKGASWSHVGIACAHIEQELPTMQIGWVTTDVELRRVWLHEAGHSLGLDHEHGTRTALKALQFDMDGVRRWCDSNRVDFEVWHDQWFSVTAPEVVEHVVYDPESIMGYYIPGEWMLDGQPRGGATTLSILDRLSIRRLYGAPPQREYVTWLPNVQGGERA